MLYINGLKREDIGDYECFVYNSVGLMYKIVYLMCLYWNVYVIVLN